jgi:hypothetical protein
LLSDSTKWTAYPSVAVGTGAQDRETVRPVTDTLIGGGGGGGVRYARGAVEVPGLERGLERGALAAATV